MMKYKLLVLFSFIVLSSSCQTSKENSKIQLINSEALKTLVKQEGVQFIDVRTVPEFNESHIKGAENIVYDSDFSQKLSQLDQDKPVVLYCRSGRRSAASAKILADIGFTVVYDLDGGILKWIKEGNEVQ